jgi:YHS domain-containing protein
MKTPTLRILLSLVAFGLGTIAALGASAHAGPSSGSTAYPLDVCIVSGEVLGEEGEPVVKDYDGRELRFCCKGCVKDFEKAQAKYLAKLDEAIVAQQLPLYPLDTCVVTGKRLGEAGEPVNYVHGNRLIRFCSAKCPQEFEKNPSAYVAKLDAAVVSSQLADYPAATCPISGEKLGSMGEPYDYVFAGKLVRFCCGGCVRTFNENPSAALAKVYGASGAPAPAGAAAGAGDHHAHGEGESPGGHGDEPHHH